MHLLVPSGHDGNPYKDGGVVDRIGLRAWREHRRQQLGPSGRIPPALVHLISRCVPILPSGLCSRPFVGRLRPVKQGSCLLITCPAEVLWHVEGIDTEGPLSQPDGSSFVLQPGAHHSVAGTMWTPWGSKMSRSSTHPRVVSTSSH
jgi:hypothetical protein